MVLMPPSVRTETKYKVVTYTAERVQNSTTILSIEVLSSILAKFPLLPDLTREVCTNLSHVVASLEGEQQNNVSPWKKRRTSSNTFKKHILPTLHLQTKRDTDVTPKYERTLFSCHESGSGNLSNGFPPESEGSTVWHDGNNEPVNFVCLLFVEWDKLFICNCALQSYLTLGCPMGAVLAGSREKS